MNQAKALLVALVLVFPLTSQAVARPAQRHEATGNKTKQYISEGFFVGGERSVTSARLKDIRRAKSSEGFERIVLDLQVSGEDKNGVPYFQVQLSPNEGRVVLSIWADVMYDFDAGHVMKAFGKSASIKRLNIVPRVEEGLTVIEFMLHPAKGEKKVKLEAFRLSSPPRIILDVL